MKQAQHPLGQHLSTCSGPDNCAEYLAVLSMTPEQHANYINDSTARFAQQRTSQRRACATEDDYSAPIPTRSLRRNRPNATRRPSCAPRPHTKPGARARSKANTPECGVRRGTASTARAEC